jgi:hypothetical protein
MDGAFLILPKRCATLEAGGWRLVQRNSAAAPAQGISAVFIWLTETGVSASK